MKSWVQSANLAGCQFPIENLPFGVASLDGSEPVCVSAIGDFVVNLSVLEREKLLDLPSEQSVFDKPYLNDFMALGPDAWKSVRTQLAEALAADAEPAPQADIDLWVMALVNKDDVTMHLPFRVSEYTDFYAGMQHARNTGAMLRGMDNLPAN